MHKYILAGIATALMLAGCVSAPKMTAEQCAAINWYDLGKADGLAGQSMTAINDEADLCRPHGVTPDLETYKAGRREGLQTFCQPASLLEASLKLQGDPFSCDPMTTEMKTAFETGRDTRLAVQRYQSYKQQYDKLTQQKQQINNEGARLTQQYNQTSDQAVRKQIADRIRQLRQQLEAVDAEIAKADPVMEQENSKYETAVQAYESYRSGLVQ